MSWMVRWAGAFPLFVERAEGARFTDVDGREYVDLCLGDTGAMTGHSPAAAVEAIRAQLGRGLTFMLPTEDGIRVSEELARRFGLPAWQMAMTATDANRFAIRIARHVTGRPRILVFNWCYHGTVDETFATLEGGRVVARPGNVGPPVDPAVTTRVVEFNDVAGLERELAAGDVACVLAEPAMTNIGIVLPEPASTGRCASSPGARRPCSSSTRPTPSAPGRAAAPGPGGSRPTSSRSASPSRAASPPRSTASRPRWRSAGAGGRRWSSPTPAASAARSPGTRSPSPRCGPRSSRC
jgi:hypothetical protein